MAPYTFIIGCELCESRDTVLSPSELEQLIRSGTSKALAAVEWFLMKNFMFKNEWLGYMMFSPFSSSLTPLFDKNLVEWLNIYNLVADVEIVNIGPWGKCLVSKCSILDTETSKDTMKTLEVFGKILCLIKDYLALLVISEVLSFLNSLSMDVKPLRQTESLCYFSGLILRKKV